VADHPVKVPEELSTQWWEEAVEAKSEYWPTYVANRAAQWAADQELEACCEWLRARGVMLLIIEQLRASRRPKPQTLAEQGMAVVRQLKNLGSAVDLEGAETKQQLNVLEEALNRLAELEAQQ
jgi:hypothetical protein